MTPTASRTRRRHFRQGHSFTPEFDISSLIDVGFLLLIYFIVTSSLQKKETDLSLILPTEEKTIDTRDANYCPIDLELLADGRIALNDEIIATDNGVRDPGSLNQRLGEITKLARATGQTPVAFVHADDAARHQRLIDIVNALARHEIRNVTMDGLRN